MTTTLEHQEPELLRVKAELEKVHRHQQIILDSVWEGIIGLDRQGNHTFVNHAAARILGYTVEELLGHPAHATWHHTRAKGSPYAETECPIIAALKQGTPHVSKEEVFWRKDGTSCQVEYTSTPIIENKEVVGGVVIFWDISERKEAEDLSRNLMAWSPVGIYLIKDRKFAFTNRWFHIITGYSDDELLLLDIEQLIHPEDRLHVRSNAIEMLKGKSYAPYEYRTITKGGEVRWIMETVTAIQLQGRRAILGFFVDITERKKLEDQFLQAQKMEALARFAGGLAHDFSNMLGIIMLYVAIMLKDTHTDDRFYPHAKGIKEAAEQAIILTRQLLTLGSRQIMEPRATDLNIIVIEIDKMLRHLIGEDIELVLTLEPAALVVKVDPGQLEQVIMNLAVNARDAMPQGGRLTIATANVSLDKSYASRHIDVSPGPYVMVAVSDTGMGMDELTLTHIFEPFYTTKESGKGSGLGLFTTYGIVKKCGGFIEVESEVGHGTTFKVFFPKIRKIIKPQAKTPESGPLQGSETILVVEDEDKLRELISNGLKGYGYTVLTARHGKEALLICERHQGPIHLILTDMVMPQMSGRELVERLGLIYPEMKILYMSGYTRDQVICQELMDGIFIQKPFYIITLAEKVREMLDYLNNT
jgi:two-component system, cell cycle sensor histidine kinase and response regulator CckA